MGNRLLGMTKPTEVPEKGEAPKPSGGWAYHYKTGKGKLFSTRDERNVAFASGEWVKSPALVPGHRNYKGDKKPEMGICRFFIDDTCTRHFDGGIMPSDEDGDRWTPEYEDKLSESASAKKVADALAPEPVDYEKVFKESLTPQIPEDEGPIPEIGRPEPKVVRYKKYPANMNKLELIAEGARLGLELDEKLTNKKMRALIWKKTGYRK